MIIFRYLLISVFVFGSTLSGNARLASHIPVNLTEIVAQHQVEMDDHGHSHEDSVDVSHAYHGHAHDVADHDHNPAFVMQRRGANSLVPKQVKWPVTQVAILDRRVFELDRPPRS